MPFLGAGPLATLAVSVARSGARAADFLLAQQAAIDEEAKASQAVTLPTRSGNGVHFHAGAATSNACQSMELDLAVPTDWRTDE